MDSNVLKNLQRIETEILVVVDKFCREHGITYSLYAGTALGAVRHGGFIPWDDDIDICMARNEYDRFLQLWRENPTEGYRIAGDDEKNCKINHTKILKIGTVWSNKIDMEKDIPHEIWLDVFAMDKVPTDEKLRKKLLKNAKLRLVYTRNYPYKGGSLLLNIISRLLLAKSNARKIKLKEKYTKAVTCYKDMTDDYEFVDLSCPGALRFFNPKNLFDVENIDFAGNSVLISKYADEMLTIHYGDYMQMPPVEKQVSNHMPEIVDFGD